MSTFPRVHVALCSLALLGGCTGEVNGTGAGGGASSGNGGASGSSAGSSGKSGKGGSSAGGASGSSGSSGSAGVGGNVDDLCAANMGELKVGRTRLRRLTRAQLNNTLRDL